MDDAVTDAFRRGALEHIVNSRPKIALFAKSAQLGSDTEKYSIDGEVRGQGYQAGGMSLESAEVMKIGDVFSLVFNTPSWPVATITARGALIYLADDGGKAVRVIDFGKDVTSTNGPFVVNMPSAADGGLISL